MSVSIKKVSDTEFMVNNKPVYLNSDDKWIAKNLTQREIDVAYEHIASITKQ